MTIIEILKNNYCKGNKDPLRTLLRKEIYEINSKISSLTDVLKTKKAILELMNQYYCSDCNGEGFTREYHDMQEFNAKSCKSCKGTGLNLKDFPDLEDITV